MHVYFFMIKSKRGGDLGNKTKPHVNNLCGAKTRSGKPCKNHAMPNGRCRLHGGKSTGPKDREKQSKSQQKNKNSEKHGLFSKYLPQETMDLVNNIESLNTIDILWDNIKIQYAAIIRAQRIMYVEDREDDDIHTLEKTIVGQTPKKENITVNKLQVITANEKQSNFLQAQSRAMNTLSKMLKDYEELLKNDLATETQKARLDQIKVKTEKLKGISSDIEDMSELRRLLLNEGD